MDPLTLSLLIGGGANILGGVIGNIASQGDRDAQRAAQEAALAQMTGLSVPQLQQITPELYKSITAPTMEREKALAQAASEMKGVSADPRLALAQMQALQQMQAVGSSGFTDADRAAIAEAQKESDRALSSKEASIRRNLEERGLASSGQEIAMREMAAQEAANRNSSLANQQAQMALQRQLDAISKSGQLASSMRGQEFREKSDAAKAQDIINAFNTNLAAGSQSRNVASANEAAMRQWANQQDVANKSVATANEAQQMNKITIPQAQFGMAAQKAGAVSKAESDRAAGYGADAAATQKMWSGIGSGIGQGAAAYGDYEAKKKLMGA